MEIFCRIDVWTTYRPDCLTATFLHPPGTIGVNCERPANGLKATIFLPGTLIIIFVFNKIMWSLSPGANYIHIQ